MQNLSCAARRTNYYLSVRVNDERWEQHLGDWKGCALPLFSSPSARDICEIPKTGPPLAISGPSRDTQRADRAMVGKVTGCANISTVGNASF